MSRPFELKILFPRKKSANYLIAIAEVPRRRSGVETWSGSGLGDVCSRYCKLDEEREWPIRRVTNPRSPIFGNRSIEEQPTTHQTVRWETC
jgi:hypothetical protein